MSRFKYEVQLYDPQGRIITDTGGLAVITGDGTPDRAAVASTEDATPATTSNPISFDKGKLTFYTVTTLKKVDVFGIAPGGQAFQMYDVGPGGHDLCIDTQVRQHVLVVPFSHADSTANTETDTGIDEPTNALMLPNPFVRVVDLDATETIDVGTDSTDSGNADGFMDGVSIATAAIHKGTLASGGQTLGALLSADESGAGVLVPEGHVSAGKSITYTTSAGTDTASGFIHLPYLLSA